MLNRTLAEMVYSLSTEQLLELQSRCVEAGIQNEFKADYRQEFQALKQSSSGKLKKLYTALSRATPDQMRKISDILVGI